MDKVFYRHKALPIFGVSVILFATSLLLPAFYVPRGPVSAVSALIFGWLGVLMHEPHSGIWLANPILVLSWALLGWKRGRPSTALGSAALVLGTTFLFASNVVTDESGVPGPIKALGPGYWLWLSSMLAVVAGSVFRNRSSKIGRQTIDPKP